MNEKVSVVKVHLAVLLVPFATISFTCSCTIVYAKENNVIAMGLGFEKYKKARQFCFLSPNSFKGPVLARCLKLVPPEILFQCIFLNH